MHPRLSQSHGKLVVALSLVHRWRPAWHRPRVMIQGFWAGFSVWGRIVVELELEHRLAEPIGGSLPYGRARGSTSSAVPPGGVSSRSRRHRWARTSMDCPRRP